MSYSQQEHVYQCYVDTPSYFCSNGIIDCVKHELDYFLIKNLPL